jgi:ABC-type multidrug transport system ATPase subunit
MGASGAGKTTLLNALSGKIRITAGSVKISGVEAESIRKLTRIVGFVPQADVMLPMLTVREQLRFSAHLRMPRNVHRADVETYVGLILEMLGLDHVQHTIVGDERMRGISGGQKKRVNVGIELAANPALVFLDEPTSGLDSTSAVELLNCLRAFARHGVTVAAVVHQPRWAVFSAFDDLVLLRSGGYTEYVGPTLQMASHFEKQGFPFPARENPADFMMDIISGEVERQGGLTHDKLAPLVVKPPFWADMDVRSHADRVRTCKSILSKLSHNITSKARKTFTRLSAEAMLSLQRSGGKRQIASFPLQVWLFTKRGFTQQRRDLSTIIRNYASLFIASMLLGTLNATNRANAAEINPVPALRAQSRASPGEPITSDSLLAFDLYMRTIAAVFSTGYTLGMLAISISGLQSALDLFGAERTVFFRDFRVKPSILAYVLGKNLASLPLIFLYPYIFLTCFYSIMQPIATFGQWMLVLISLQFSVEGLGQFISVAATSNRQVVGGLAALVFCMFSGVFPEAQNIPVSIKGTRDLSFARYAMELILLAEYHPIYNLATNATITDDQSALVQQVERAKWTAIRDTGRATIEGLMVDRYELSLPDDPLGPFVTSEARHAFQSLITSGIVWRLLAYMSLVLLGRKERR